MHPHVSHKDLSKTAPLIRRRNRQGSQQAPCPWRPLKTHNARQFTRNLQNPWFQTAGGS